MNDFLNTEKAFMEYPDKGFSGSSSSEKGNGLNIEIHDEDLIYKALDEGQKGQIGRVFMENPIEEITINAKPSENKTFDLQATIDLDILSVMGPRKNSGNVTEEVSKALSQLSNEEIKERNNAYIIRFPSGMVFTVRDDIISSKILISSSIISSNTILSEEVYRVAPSPQLTKENLKVSLSDISDIVRIATDKIYHIFGKQSPTETMEIHPPRIFNERSSNPFNLEQTPDDLLGKIEIEKPNIQFEDIGGQEEAKREIEGISFALKNPELYKKWGTKPPKGVILHGPPGTGKTLMAKALASQANARFFHVKSSDIASKWYGESEKIVQQIFDLATEDKQQKVIIFFDEIDSIAPPRDGSHEATQRTISTLLENMDGVEGQENVMIVASTNRLNNVDDAILRAGRFDRWVEVPLPDEKGRKEIFDIHMNKAKNTAQRELFNNINIDTLVVKTSGSSGADIAEILRRTLEEKVRQEGLSEQNSPLVTTEDIEAQIQHYEKVKKTKKAMGFLAEEET